ncbi:hypothetical protein WJX72_012127 [[Myrmecia] bisecta]|uniref:Uncharacterized protein n=1 Tax=[Myrmecia] bisecta TaxID=41462 RepID=A0AAW1Q2E6_9CHLO
MYSNRRSSTPQGGRGAAQAWGSGFRSDQHDNRQGGGSGRRVEFGSATNQGRGQQSQGGRRQENRQGGRGEPAADWRTLVRHDWQNERPMWPLTCYGHQRDQPNDIEGETSPEEVRWAQMEAARSGQSVQQLQGEFQAAVQAKDDQFQVLLRASRPPSLGGPPIPPTPALGSAPVFGASAPPSLGFGQFGSQAAPPGPAFGTPAPAFMTGGGAFGGGNVRPSFGGGAAPSFGSAAPFGQAGFGTPATPGVAALLAVSEVGAR